MRPVGILAALAAAVGLGATAVVVLARDETDEFVREARELSQALRPVKVVRLRPVEEPPPPPQPRHVLDPGDEGIRRPTRAAPIGAPILRASADAPTVATRILHGARAAGGIARVRSHPLPLSAVPSLIAEPTVATNGTRALLTWNFGAAFTSDGGRTYTFVNPATALPATKGGFCCDQVAHYIPGRDLWVWLLQYYEDSTGNVLRLAVAAGEEAFDAARDNAATLYIRDFPPASFGASSATPMFDFNNISHTREHLFIATNLYDAPTNVGLVMRIPLEDIASRTTDNGNITYVTTGDVATPRLVQGATDAMYFAGHVDKATLRVFRWADDADGPTAFDVRHSQYPNRRPRNCPRRAAPGGADWCEGRRNRPDGVEYVNDDAVLTGWLANGTLGFGWNASEARERGFPYPFVMLVEIDEETRARVREDAIWNRDYAYQYPAIVPNFFGELGGIVLAGGGTLAASCVGLVRERLQGNGKWSAAVLRSGTANPLRSGDYFGLTPTAPADRTWGAACMVQRGPRGPRDTELSYIVFGPASASR